MRLHLAVRTSATGSGVACWEIRTGSTPGRARLLELGIFLGSSTSSTFGLGYPAAIGINPTSPVDFIPEDPNNVIASGVVQSALAWGTGPTSPTAFLRRISLPSTTGTGVIWTFPSGIVIPVSSSIVLWNLTSVAASDCYAVVEI